MAAPVLGYGRSTVIVRFNQETVEDRAGRLHGVGCERLTFVREAVRHQAGTTVDRDRPPRECWACHPAVDVLYASGGEAAPRRR